LLVPLKGFKNNKETTRHCFEKYYSFLTLKKVETKMRRSIYAFLKSLKDKQAIITF